MKKLIYILFAATLVWSCELMVEVDLPQDPPKLVVNALFHPDSTWLISISETAHILSEFPPRLAYEPLPQLRGEDGVLIPLVKAPNTTPPFGLPGISNAWFYRASTKPEVGKTYRIDVSAYNHAPVFAVASTPSVVPIISAVIDSANMIVGESVDGDFSLAEKIFPIDVSWQDPAGLGDYYFPQMLIIYPPRPVYIVNGDTTWGQNVVPFYLQTDLQSNDFLEFGERADVVDDRTFDGKQITLRRYFKVFPYGPGGEHDSGTPTSIRFVLHHSGVEYHRYFLSVQLQNLTSGNPFAQPVQVYSNVEGGLGVFLGYSASSWELRK